MFKRLLDPKAEKRPVSVLEVNKYLEDRWLAKLGVEKALNGQLILHRDIVSEICHDISATFLFISAGGADERDELCPSMYSFHSSLEEKNQLLHTLTTYGIETTVDHSKKKDRIREWIQASAIVEENEEDESDIYEDSEFYEDEDRDNDGNGSKEPESVSMRDRHFPERRPSAATNSRRRRSGSRVATGRVVSKNRVPAKPIERKIPFAPQVAEERETIARFASFPNGDPNLAVRNGGDRSHDLSATSVNVATDVSPTTNNFSASNLQSSAPSANGRNVKDLTRTSANNSRDESPISALPVAAVPVEQSPPKTTPSIPNGGSRMAVPMSPQIPARKNRAHTAPYSDARSAEAQADSARRTQSATVLRTPETEDPPLLPPRASAKTSVSPHPASARADSSSVATLSTSRAARSVAPPIDRADRAPAAPIISSASLAESQASNSALPGRVEDSPPIATQITTSAASHLAMQSFNALQGIAGAISVASPASSSSNTNKSGHRAEGLNMTYGKDAYEHYGIAQGVILPMRVNIVRQDSTGSGSRSVSN